MTSGPIGGPRRVKARDGGAVLLIAAALAGVLSASALAAPQLEYSVVADTQTDNVTGVAADRDGSVWMTGTTINTQLPLSANAADRTLAGVEEGYVLKLDPQGHLVYASYLGGNSLDYPGGIAVDRDGNVYIAGATYSTDFPLAGGAQQTEPAVPGLSTLFVTKLDASGNLIYSSYYGGSGGDGAYTSGRGAPSAGIAIAPDGGVLVASATLSGDFPVVDAYQPGLAGRRDAVLIKFNPDFTVAWATYFGGSNDDIAYRVVSDGDGNPYILGGVSRQFGEEFHFPVTAGAFQVDSTHDASLFVAKFAAAGDLGYATFVAPTSGRDSFPYDSKGDLGVDAAGNVYVVAVTESDFVPTTPGAYQPQRRGFQDLFLAKLGANGADLLFSTYFGGSSSELAVGFEGVRIAVDGAGHSYVGAETQSSDLPVLNPIAASQIADAFVASFQPDGSLAYSSYIDTPPTALAVRRGALYIGGRDPDQQATIRAAKVVESLCADCDRDGAFGAGDMVAATRLALGNPAQVGCEITDADGDGSITGVELVGVAELLFSRCRI